MQKHKCKLCFKSFINGRALGGHMKSHLVSSSNPPARKRLSDSVYSSSSSSSSSDCKTFVYGLRENPRKSSRVFKPDRDSSNSETETEPEPEPETEDPVCKRVKAEVAKKKKRRNKSRKKQKTSHVNSKESQEPVSSISDGSPEQDLAICLMMLSRDSRVLKKQVLEEGEGEETKVVKKHCPELRRCVIDLNLPPPPQDGDVVTVV